CNGTDNLRSLRQLGGMWEIDGDDDMVKNKDRQHLLGVCYQHFMFHQNRLHPEHYKGDNPIKDADFVLTRSCLFCNTMKTFSFSRGTGCSKHSAKVNEHSVQVPCLGADCIFTEGSIAQKHSSGYRARYICTNCFKQQGGHLREKVGKNKEFVSCGKRGEHRNDINDALYNIGRWIMSVSESNNRWLQKKLFLLLLTPILAILNTNDQTAEVDSTSEAIWPSKLLVGTALKLGKVDLTHTVTSEKPSVIG